MGGNGERHDRDGKKIGCILACRTRERAIDVGKKGGYDSVIGHSGESMSKVLTLQLPEELYNPLLEIAQRWGQSPEEVTLQWLKSSIQQFTDDPLEPLIGSFQSNIPDWTEHHDRYLGENLLGSEEN